MFFQSRCTGTQDSHFFRQHIGLFGSFGLRSLQAGNGRLDIGKLCGIDLDLCLVGGITLPVQILTLIKRIQFSLGR